MPSARSTPRRSLRGPVALLAAAVLGLALAGGALVLAERLREPPPALHAAETPPVAARAREPGAPPPEGAALVWRCPMHPQVARDRPGTCPICGMRLVKDVAPTR